MSSNGTAAMAAAPSSVRRASVSTTKSSDRVEICIRHVKPYAAGESSHYSGFFQGDDATRPLFTMTEVLRITKQDPKS